jgi:hypothetical protein
LLHLLGIVLSVTRSRGQTGKAQAVQQIVDTSQRIGDPEFLFEHLLGLFATERADTVGLGRTGQETPLEKRLLGRRQVGRPAGLSLGGDRRQTVIPIRVDPSLHKPSAARQGLCDGWGTVAFKGQKNGPIAVSLLGIILLATLLTQLRQILPMMEFNLHPTVPPVSPRVCQRLDDRATLF